MKTIATVIAVDGELATVETERTSACEGCHKKEDGGCSVCTLMGGNGRKLVTRAENRARARVGDRVTVESATGRILGYAAMVFLMPLVTCLAGGLLASALTAHGGLRVLGAALGFGAWFPVLRLISSRLQGKRPDAVVTEILPMQQESAEAEDSELQ